MKKFAIFLAISSLTLIISAPVSAEESVDDHLNQGYQYQVSGNEEAAIKEYEAVLAIEPDNRYALQNLAQIYVNKNEFQKAVKKLNKLIELDPDDGAAYLGLAVCYMNLREFEKALVYNDKALSLNNPQAKKLDSTLKNFRSTDIVFEYSSKFSDQSKIIIKIHGSPAATGGDPALIQDILSTIEVYSYLAHLAHADVTFKSVDAAFLGFENNSTSIKKWLITWSDGRITAYKVKNISSPQGGTEFAVEEIKE